VNWQVIGVVSEVIASFAVVVSLFYLARQLRSSIGIEKARASFDATHSWAASNQWLHQDVEFQNMLSKYLDENTPWEEIDRSDRWRISVFFRGATFQPLEGQYYLFKHGYLEPDIWEKRARWASGFIRSPMGSGFWEVELSQSIYSDEFIQAVEAAEPISVLREAKSG
jgi:hypothetical protein